MIRVTGNFENQIELRAFAFNTLHWNAAAHLLNDWLANAETQTATRGVRLTVLFQIAEAHKQALKFRFWNAATKILNLKLKL